MFGLFSKKRAEKKAARKSADIRSALQENMRTARENIGDETLDKIAQAMSKMQKSRIQTAKRTIQAAGTTRASEELRSLMREEKT